MKLNKNFVKSLDIPFSKVMPHGGQKEIQQQLEISVHTPRQVLAGAWTNEDVVKAALRIIRAQRDYLDQFLAQFPSEAFGQNGQPSVPTPAGHSVPDGAAPETKRPPEEVEWSLPVSRPGIHQ